MIDPDRSRADGDRTFGPRTVVGVMTGTSMDGADVACVRLRGSGRELDLRPGSTGHVAYPSELRRELLDFVAADRVALERVARLDAVLAEWISGVVGTVLEGTDLPLEEVDLVGSHGQTVVHRPRSEPIGGRTAAGTIQLGSGSALAARLGRPVVSDFRSADLALGGEGAPLVPYFDWAVLTDERRARLVVNLGGIANLTVLPGSGTRESVRAFDAGPANMVIDALVRRLFEEPFDADGRRAREGSVCADLLDEIRSEDPFPDRAPPRSTGRTEYGPSFVRRLLRRADRLGCTGNDLVATATEYSARVLYESYERFVADRTPVDEVLVSGGGRRNRVLMERIERAFDPVPVRSTAAAGVDPDYKEAICFAVLAHERANGVSAAMPRVTGASAPARLGQIALPPAGRVD